MVDNPNFIIIMPDQHRADVLGMVNPQVKTPNLDRLASEGVRFANAITQSPLCVPARAAFLVGKYVHETGAYTNKMFIHKTNPMLIKDSFLNLLKKRGYRNIDIGKMHLVRHHGYDALKKAGDKNLKIIDNVSFHYDKMEELGFTECQEVCGKMESAYVGSKYIDSLQEHGFLKIYHEWAMKYPILLAEPMPIPKEFYIDYFVGDMAIKWLENHLKSPKSDKPFCLFIGFPGPHDPFDVVKEYADLYDPDEIQLIDEELEEPKRPFPKYIMRSRIISRSKHVTEDYIRKARAMYYGNVTLIDEKVGEIRKILEENGVLDNTWIIYTSDHGEQLGSHKLFMKFVFYRESVNVPLIIRPPQGMKGKVIENDVELIDVPTTLLDILNIDLPPNHRGKSLLPLIMNEKEGTDYQHKELCISQVGNYAMGLTKKWKFVVDSSTGKLLELYEREHDYYENNNLALISEEKHTGEQLYRKYLEKIIPKIEIPGGFQL
ncbi:MAG: sulfatase-like hydrolase/transferase [Promethearchaeota archaeon]